MCCIWHFNPPIYLGNERAGNGLVLGFSLCFTVDQIFVELSAGNPYWEYYWEQQCSYSFMLLRHSGRDVGHGASSANLTLGQAAQRQTFQPVGNWVR